MRRRRYERESETTHVERGGDTSTVSRGGLAAHDEANAVASVDFASQACLGSMRGRDRDDVTKLARMGSTSSTRDVGDALLVMSSARAICHYRHLGVTFHRSCRAWTWEQGYQGWEG